MFNNLVSVVIPTFGRPEHLKRAINSVINQSFKPIEIIVVDDNDPKSAFRAETEVVMQEFLKLANINYLKHDQNMNGSAARNTGFKSSTGSYVTFLDDDDEFLPDKIHEQVGFLEKNKEYAACYCKTSYALNNSIIRQSSFSKSGDFLLDVFMLKHKCNTSAFLFRRNTLISLDGFDESFNRHQDIELLVRFFKTFLMGFVNEFLLIRHLDSRINMPSVTQYIDIKSKFLKRFTSEIESFPTKIKKKIYASHNADLFFYCLRSLEFKLALRFYPGFYSLLVYLYNNFSKIPGILARRFKSKRF